MLGRHVGISAFCLLGAATWLEGAHAIHPLRVDPIRATLGTCAWVVYALSWGARRQQGDVDTIAADRDAPLLLPRSTIPIASVALFATGILAALFFFASAWQVRDTSRSLAAQAIALGCALVSVDASVIVAVSRGNRRAVAGRRITPRAVRSLVLLASIAIAGAVITAMR
jgi:hypothetical protein